MRTIAMVAGALLAAGCTTARETPAGPPVAIETATISYETGPCFGTCPVYTVTVAADGRGTFEGRRFTAVTGTRTFDVGAEAYRRLLASVASWRPADGEKRYEMGSPECGNPPTDMPSRTVRWSELSGGSQMLYFYDGCRVGNERLAAALTAFPDQLPIASFIKAR